MNFNAVVPDSVFEKVLMMQNMITALGTGGDMSDSEYLRIRTELISDLEIRPLLPSFVRTCRDSGTLWAYLKSVHEGGGAYSVRRKHVNDAFAPLLDHLEVGQAIPSDTDVAAVLSRFDGEGVQAAWAKALKRRSTDPEGAITAARTLLEEVCKHILDGTIKEDFSTWDLPKLYGRTSKQLNLAPSQHTQEVFKRILGGCHTVVDNLGELRNKIGDAHGQGRKPIKPAPRHAALAVNLAGSMAMFLIETWLDANTFE
jgi:hypothetical protein